MVWAAALGVFLQLWVNIEIGRWAIVTGEAPYTGFARVWMGFIYALLFVGFVTLFLPGWARISGAALKALLFGPDGPGPDWMWTGLTFVSVALVLFGPKVMYRAVERITIGLVVFMTLGLIFVAFQVGTLDAVGEMARGLVNFGHIELDDEFPFSRFFGAVVFAGAGGAGNLWYAFYLRDKGIGMGARMPTLRNPLRGGADTETPTGYTYPDTEPNRRAFKDWLRWVVFDQTLVLLAAQQLYHVPVHVRRPVCAAAARSGADRGPDYLGRVAHPGREPGQLWALSVPGHRHGRPVQHPAGGGRRRRPGVGVYCAQLLSVRPARRSGQTLSSVCRRVHAGRHCQHLVL